jgi:hypothetical protein
VDLADRETVTAQDLAKMKTILAISPRSPLPGRTDIVAVQREQGDAAHEIRQLCFDFSQQTVVGAHIGGVGRHGAAEPCQKVLEIADVIVDLRGKHSRVMDGTLFRGRLSILPLTPETQADERQERSDGGEHKNQ